MKLPPRLPLKIKPLKITDDRCPLCHEKATELFDMHCDCCSFAEVCCRACASPEALHALAQVLVYRKRIDEGAGALIERETWEAEP